MTSEVTEDSLVEDMENYIATLFPRFKAMDTLTLHYLLSRAIARVLFDLYGRIEEVLTIVDPLKATGEDLEHLCSSRLLTRELGDYATGTLTFGLNTPSLTAVTIPEGTRCKADEYVFITTESGTITAGTLSCGVAAQAEDRGTDGNVSIHTINQIYDDLPDVDYVDNLTAFTGGTEDETDDELRQRYIDITTLPGLATSEMVQRRLEDLEHVVEAIVQSRGSGDVEIVVDDTYGTTQNDDDIPDELDAVMATGCQACGCRAAVTVVSGNITPVTDPISLTDADCAGGYMFLRPTTDYISSDDTFDVDYVEAVAGTQTVSVTIPAGTRRGEMVQAPLNATDHRAVSIPTKAFTGAHVYDILLGMGEPGFLYNVPTDVTYDVTIAIVATDTPETDLADNIEASITNWFADYIIGEQVEWSDLRTCAILAYEAATNVSQKHELLGTERPFIGINRITSFSVVGSGDTLTKDGDISTLENDERAVLGTVTITVT